MRPLALNGVVRVAVMLVPVAYLIGTFPSADLVARSGRHDVHREGSGNPGASNVARLMGWRAGLVVAAADLAKGALAAGLGMAVGGRPGALLLGAAAVLGHVAPATRRLRGGRGVATAAGALLVCYPLIVAVAALVWALLVRLLRVASVASLAVATAFPVTVAVRGGPTWEVAATGGLAALIVVRHLPNLARLLGGRELRIDGEHRGDP